MEGVHVWMGATGYLYRASGKLFRGRELWAKTWMIRRSQLWESSREDSHLVLAWEQPGTLEEQEEGQSGCNVHREGWNGAKGGQEGKRGQIMEGPAGHGEESGFYVKSAGDTLKRSYKITWAGFYFQQSTQSMKNGLRCPPKLKKEMPAELHSYQTLPFASKGRPGGGGGLWACQGHEWIQPGLGEACQGHRVSWVTSAPDWAGETRATAPVLWGTSPETARSPPGA